MKKVFKRLLLSRNRKLILCVKIVLSPFLSGLFQASASTYFQNTELSLHINSTEETILPNTLSLQPQGSKVSGRVTDDEGVPIPGATVMDIETSRGVITDIDGYYSIEVSSNSKLQFSFIGMFQQIIDIEGQSELNVELKSKFEELDGVVIVGYGTQKKGSVIGSIDAIEPEQLKQPTRTLSTSLAGRLAGVVAVQSSGEPGYDGANFWIRGVNTFTGNTSPLILIDGVERDLDNVDPEEIADFTILKDATATAIYGVRGANGVVLITTKKGRIGKPQINIRMENGFTNPLKLPDFVDGPTYMRLQNEALQNSGNTPIYSEDQINKTAAAADPYYYPNVDWMDELLSPWPANQRINLNVSGGGEQARYFVSGAFLNQNGMWKRIQNNSYNNNVNIKRYNFRSNVDVNVTNSTLLTVQLATILDDRNYPGYSSSNIFGTMLNTPPVWYPVEYPDKTKIPGYPYGMARSPYQQLVYSGFTSEYHSTLQSNMIVNQDLEMAMKGLKAKFMFAFDSYTNAKVKRVMRPRPYLIKPWGFDENGEPILINQKGEYNYEDQEPSSTSYHDYLVRESDRPYTDRSVYIEASLMYNRNFRNHEVGAMFLYNHSDHMYPSTEGLYDAVPRRHQGVTGRATYSYRNRYFFEFNFGYNGSENFAKGNRFGFFPSYAIGWVPTEEQFMDFIKPAVQYMKIKLSHGEVGNDRVGATKDLNDNNVNRFAYLTRVEETDTNVGFGTNNGYGYGSGKGISIIYYGNPDATWETAIKTDLGVEVDFFTHFHLQADVFYEKRVNIWTQLTKVPGIFGFDKSIPGANVGEMENIGVDGFLEFNKVISKDWTANFKGTFSYAKNRVLANGSETPKYEYQSQIGQPFGRLLGYIADGLFTDQAEIDKHPDQSYLGTSKPGDIKYRDVNNDGVINNHDRQYIGSPSIPEITFGLGVGFTYKDVDFAVLFQGASNVSFFAAPKPFPEVDRRNVWTFVEESRWTEENQNIYADFPRLGVGAQNNNYVSSTWWLQDGKYVRLKQIELGYSIPKIWMSKFKMRGARVYFNGLNLLTLSKFKWWDPESRSGNGMYYPPQQVVNFGVEAKF